MKDYFKVGGDRVSCGHDAENVLLDNGYEGVKYLVNYSYDDALIGVSTDNRAIYDYGKMVE